jgi:SAM-dependent methyltransferase
VNNEAKERARADARRLAAEYAARGDATGWFEALYRQGVDAVPWADLEPNPTYVRWADAHGLAGDGRAALVTGCGLGDDAEDLAGRGFAVTAFDIAPSVIEWCRANRRGEVTYEVADLTAPPPEWLGAFDFVLDIATVQAIPTPEVRRRGLEMLPAFLKPGGELLMACRGRTEDEPPGTFPWPLTRAELGVLTGPLTEVSFSDLLDDEGVRRFVARYRRTP